MELILKKDNKTLEFVSGSQTLNTGDVNLNDDLLHVLTVNPELELSKDGRESLAVVFEFGSTEDITVPLTFLEKSGKYVCAFPDTVLATAGGWEITILRRRYKNANHEGNPAQTASNTYSFTVSESVKSNGTPVTAAMLQTLYDNADERATDAETAKAAAEASESNAKSYAESALEYRNEARVAAENAAADATEKANKAAADAETAREAAVSAKVAAGMAQADAESAATLAAADAVREVNERINATDTKVNDLETDIAVLNNALIIGGITYKADTETAYNERITADGLNVLDGSKAVLKKVVGSTVKCNNLIPFPYISGGVGTTQTSNGITFTVNADGSITAKGTATAETYFQLCMVDFGENSWYSMMGGTTNGFYFKDCNYNANNKYSYIVVAKGATVDTTYYPMVNEGETALPYEPYFEGLKNASFAGIESTGRNLIPFPYSGRKNNSGISFTVDNDGTIIVNGQNDGGGNSTYFLAENLALNAGTYTFSINSSTEIVLTIRMQDDKYIVARNGVKQTVTFDTNTVIKYAYVEIHKGNATVFENVRVTVMLNAGTTALPYEPYIEPSVFNFPQTELGKWDSIDFEQQKVVKATETIILNGTENWTVSDATYNTYKLDIYKKSAADTNIIRSNAPFGIVPKGGNPSIGYSILEIHDNSFASVDELKSYLASNPLSVAYRLFNVVETPFTDYEKSIGNEPRAYRGGTERVLGNDNAEFGAKNTLLQNYIVVKE